MSQYLFTFMYEADDIKLAENIAALLLGGITERGRTGLYYLDPITGGWKVRSEPAMSAAELKMYREGDDSSG